MDKITEQDLANRGVKGLPDVPGLTTEEMQRKLEEIAREILIPKVNELVEGLNNANSNLMNRISAPKNAGSEIVFSNWQIASIEANSTSCDNGELYNAIINWSGWTNIQILIPILQTNLPIYTTVQNNNVYIHNNTGQSYQNVPMYYVAIGGK